MEQLVVSLPDTIQLTMGQRMLTLQNQIKGGISWFYAIAGLSILNSVLYSAGVSLTFVVGLGATQFVDGFILGLVRHLDPGTATVLKFAGLGLNLFIASIFALCGILAKKRFTWPVVVGMVLYALDAIIFVVFQEWFAVVFHGLALWGLWRGLRAMKDLAALEKNQ